MTFSGKVIKKLKSITSRTIAAIFKQMKNIPQDIVFINIKQVIFE